MAAAETTRAETDKIITDKIITDKIIKRDAFSPIRERLRREGKKIVLCHGVFDLVHIGHITHFEEAKAQGDVLVVSVTSAAYTRKGPDRPYFSDENRLKFLSSLSVIDYVMLSETHTAQDVMDAVQPDVYAKGHEYADPENDVTGKLEEERDAARKYGGDMFFTSDAIVFSSSRLVNKALPILPEAVKERLKAFASEHKFCDIRKLIDAMLALKVLVVGDVIIDEYAYCDILGLMSKSAMGWSVKYKSRETFIGGSLAVARHASRFAGDVTVCGIVGSEADIHSAILNNLGSETRIDLVYSESVPTIVKTKFVVTNEPRDEYSKLLSMNAVPEWNAETDVETRSVFLRKLRENLPKFDAVIVCDFGHGLIDEEAMDLLQKRSKFLAVNCQTNSVNMGTNLITKYSRADVFSLDQRELKFAVARQDIDERESLEKLRRRFGDCEGFLTRGSSGAYAVDKTGLIYDFPAFTANVKDAVGAGDAFFVMAGLCGATGVSCETGLFLSNAMGALAARIVGNKSAVEKANLLKFIRSLTAF